MADQTAPVRWTRFGLAAKLAGCLVAVAVLFFATFGYVQQRLEQRHLEALVSLSAERTSDLIRTTAWQQMLRNDREQLYKMMHDLASEPGIRLVRIFNKEGRIAQSTNPAEIGTMVDKQAEACYACHAQRQPLTKLARKERARIFTEGSGKRTLAVIRPIENHKDCWTASCHVHPAGQRILGVIDAHLALDAVDTQLAEYRSQMLRYFAGATVLLSLFSLVFVWLVVHRPISDLMTGIRALARGQLSYRLPVRSRDEIGQLADSVNHMASELDEAHRQVTEWTRTLEDRVRLKTAELERAQKGLIASEKMASLGRLAATVAHEVNNPLFGMLTYARLTRKDLEKAELSGSTRQRVNEHLGIIERESRRCGDLMRNLLTFARQTPPQRAPMKIETVVQRAAELVQHQCDLAEIELASRLAPDLPEISGDASQIQQVLVVLLSNAIDALGKGGRITISAQRLPGFEGVHIAVSDTGPGIPADLQAQIFEPFFSTKENQHRTGLGLAIARNIVERHGGVLTVQSEPGKGAEFVVQLPLEAPPEAASPVAAIEINAPGGAS